MQFLYPFCGNLQLFLSFGTHCVVKTRMIIECCKELANDVTSCHSRCYNAHLQKYAAQSHARCNSLNVEFMKHHQLPDCSSSQPVLYFCKKATWSLASCRASCRSLMSHLRLVSVRSAAARSSSRHFSSLVKTAADSNTWSASQHFLQLY